MDFWKRSGTKRKITLGKGSDNLYTLLLRLSAPLQSWGSESVYDNRETDYMPTKSGVTGMLAAALGRKRGEPLDDLSRLRFGVRVDLQGTKLKDFQITHMGAKLNANLSNRAYLSDSIFLAGLECDEIKVLENLVCALSHPIYSLCLGRRSCPPTQPLILGIRSRDLYQALYEEEWLVPQWRRKSVFRFAEKFCLRIVLEDIREPEQKDAREPVHEGSRVSVVKDARTLTLKKDVPLSFSPLKREYGYRYIKEMPGKMVYEKQVITMTEHDPLKEWGN